jgi:hypothetical protein
MAISHPIPSISTVVPGLMDGSGITASNWPSHNIQPDTHLIQGDMLAVSYRQHEFGLNVPAQDENEVKRILCTYLVEEMMKSKHISFTLQENVREGYTTYHARAFVCADGTTRIIREYQKYNR